MISRKILGRATRAASFLCATAGIAAPAALAETSVGDTAWILSATALVLMMTLPALALFYGGLVQSKNILSVLSQCVAIACIASLVWLAAGYSIAFGDGGGANALWGGLSKAFLNGVTADSEVGTLPETVFFVFQMAFAIITPALMVGAFPERTSFAGVLIFCALWVLVVYAPVAHWVWGGGWLMSGDVPVRDFAGGLVVHATAGASSLLFARLVGKRAHFPTHMHPPHSPVLVMIGAGMLWVGWYGFNAGSALGANAQAGSALLVTHIAACTAAIVWTGIEWVKFGRPGLVGAVTGLIAGLATITPAAGSVGPVGALVIGALSSLICYHAVGLVRGKMQVDDSLDVFAVHGVGGILGTLILPFLAYAGPLAPGLGEVSVWQQFGVQLLGVIAVVAWSLIWTAGLYYGIRFAVPMRVTPDHEVEGLDVATHGERAYPQ